MKASQIALIIVAALPLFARTEKISITGAGQTVEMTDPAQLKQFRFGSGPGNFRLEGGLKVPIIHDWIATWAKPSTEPDASLPRYEVSFQEVRPSGRRQNYVVYYVYSGDTKQGYVYLPGRGEPHYEDNVFMLFRGDEWDGHWFQATEDWTKACQQALARSAPVN